MRPVVRAYRLGVLLLLAEAAACTAPNKAYWIPAVSDAEAPPEGGRDVSAGPDVPTLDAGGGADFGPPGAEGPSDAEAKETSARLDGLAPDDPGAQDARIPMDGDPDQTIEETAPPSPVLGNWTLDQSSGDRVTDMAPDGHDGLLEGLSPATAWVVTPHGRGIEFPAGGVAGAGIRIPAMGSVPAAIRGMRTFTIAAWARRTANLSRHHTIMSRQSVGDGEVFNLTFDNVDLVLYVTTPAGANLAVKKAIPTAIASSWMHVAATYDGANFRVFVEGEVGTPVAYAGNLADSSEPLYIGTNKNVTTPNQPFEGVLDEVVLMFQALDQAAIRQLRLAP